ncbi:bifunctional serine/threonine-protein kinase/formylglycine-generating enzyme family protein [Schlesneria paludicola]|uniref:bifunctional serine/threonine-protein kinase/formylglycine-generating enzyme family protein n=1 Tax=Schlesneria paludicola TaxID=360056 RepID=UPI00029B495D|nr:bifunctional serine/threonine-protein kinase/formylglycine-generating enzyme family protein [Schlesneria paludicola]
MSDDALALEDIQDLVGRVLDGRYVLEKFIDRGGYGAVYKGMDRRLGQAVAIKVGLSSREFIKEARLAAEVKHDNIVQVSDCGSDKGLAYLVMEYLHGEDLGKVFTRQGRRLTLGQLQKLVREVGDALAYAHSCKLIHRDLKPQNIILRQHVSRTGTTTGSDRFVLLDFGIASKTDSDGTQRNRTQDGAGTVEYMAPELLGKDPKSTEQSDIYAFGVILYQMMLGRVPFPQTDSSHLAFAECLNAISNVPPPPFRQVDANQKYPAAVEALVMQCLDKVPTHRPKSMAEVRQRFLAIYDAKPMVDLDAKSASRDRYETIRPDDFADTASDVESVTSRPRRDLSQKPSSAWNWLFVSMLLLGGGGAWLTLRPFVPSHTGNVLLTDTAGNTIDEGAPIRLVAGTSAKFTFAINDLPKGDFVEFESQSVPGLVELKMENGPFPATSRYVTVTAPRLNSRTTDPLSIILRASTNQGAVTFERSIQLTVESPTPWLPEGLKKLGFRVADDSWLCDVKVDEQVCASILSREIDGKEVRFRLVPAKKLNDGGSNSRLVDTFYIMENVVTNRLFKAFARSNPNFERETRVDGQRAWESETSADTPVTNIDALEAQGFAIWLTGDCQCGTLPSAAEWELAAGYWDFRMLDRKSTEAIWKKIPGTEIDAKIASGPSLGAIRQPDGTVLERRSPYGCEYNSFYVRLRPEDPDETEVWPTELTRTFTDSGVGDLHKLCLKGVPNSVDSVLKSDLKLVTRGSGFQVEAREISWLNEQSQPKSVEDLSIDSDPVDPWPDKRKYSIFPDLGFRVVILTATGGPH